MARTRSTTGTIRRILMTRYRQLLGALVLSALCVSPGSAGDADDKAAKKPMRAGDTFKDCQNCPEMIVVPAG
jgi:hypothetical protein